MSCLNVPCRGMHRGTLLAAVVGPARAPPPFLFGDVAIDKEEEEGSPFASMVDDREAAFDDDDEETEGVGHVGTPQERPAFSSRLSMFCV